MVGAFLPAALRRPSVSRSETLPQGQFTCPEDVNSRPEGSQTRQRVWDMQTEFYLGKNFL